MRFLMVSPFKSENVGVVTPSDLSPPSGQGPVCRLRGERLLPGYKTFWANSEYVLQSMFS